MGLNDELSLTREDILRRLHSRVNGNISDNPAGVVFEWQGSRYLATFRGNVWLVTGNDDKNWSSNDESAAMKKILRSSPDAKTA